MAPTRRFSSGNSVPLGRPRQARSSIAQLMVVMGVLAMSLLGPVRSAHAGQPKQEAAALSVVAGAKAKAGSYKLCAEMYEQCYRLDPSFLGYLYSAARCAQKGGQLDLGERHYREFLLRSPSEHPLRARADGHMKEIMKARKVQADQQAAAKKAAAEKAAADKAAAAKRGETPGAGAGSGAAGAGVKQPAPGMSGRAIRGWIGIGGAVVLAGAAAWLGLGAKSDADALESDLTLASGSSLIRGVTYAEAEERNASIRSGATMAAITGGVALVAAGAGAWLLLTDGKPAKSALRVSPIPGRLGAVWEFRW